MKCIVLGETRYFDILLNGKPSFTVPRLKPIWQAPNCLQEVETLTSEAFGGQGESNRLWKGAAKCYKDVEVVARWCKMFIYTQPWKFAVIGKRQRPHENMKLSWAVSITAQTPAESHDSQVLKGGLSVRGLCYQFQRFQEGLGPGVAHGCGWLVHGWLPEASWVISWFTGNIW